MGGIFRCNRYVCFLKLEGSHFSTARRLGFSATSPKVGVEPMVCWDWEWNSWGFSAGWWVKERGTDGWFPVVQGLNPGKKGAGWLGSCFGMMGSEPWDFFLGGLKSSPPKKHKRSLEMYIWLGGAGELCFFWGGRGLWGRFYPYMYISCILTYHTYFVSLQTYKHYSHEAHGDFMTVWWNHSHSNYKSLRTGG